MTENNFWHSSWFHLKSWDESSQKSMHKNVGVFGSIYGGPQAGRRNPLTFIGKFSPFP